MQRQSKGIHVAPRKPVTKNMSNELPGVLEDWNKARLALEAAKAAELALRNQVVSLAFKDAPEGTNHVEAANGCRVKADIKIGRSVDESQFAAARKYALEKNDYSLMEILDKAIRLKPEVAVGGFKALSPEDKKRLGDIVTEKLGTPQVEYIGIPSEE